MSHIETTRLNDLIAIKIAAVQEFALVAELEQATAELKTTREAIPHHPA